MRGARPPLALLGAGRAGGTLAVLLAHCGWTPGVIWSRRRATARRAARPAAAAAPDGSLPPAATVDPRRALAGAQLLLLAVPDDALAPFAGELARVGPAPANGIALHLSGVHPAAVLSPLRRSGWQIGAIHPLAILPSGVPPRRLLAGAAFGVEGTPVALRQARALARLLGGHPCLVPPAARPAYHLAAALVANDSLALLSLAMDRACRAGLPETALRRGLAHLLAGVARAARAQGPARALTGPVARGDAQTLRRHLQAAGPARRIHRDLSLVLVDLARRGGRMDAAQARRLRRALRS